jgi:hypothetical protein
MSEIKNGLCNYCEESELLVIDMSLAHNKKEFWCIKCLMEKFEELKWEHEKIFKKMLKEKGELG